MAWGRSRVAHNEALPEAAAAFTHVLRGSAMSDDDVEPVGGNEVVSMMYGS